MGKNIQVVDGAIGDLRSALQRDPMDTGLVHKLRREYQRKSALIRQTAHLLDQVLGDVALDIHLMGDRRDLAGREIGHHVAEHFLVFVKLKIHRDLRLGAKVLA